MAWTNLTDDIIVQEGTFAFDFDASGTVYGGQAVICDASMKVEALPEVGALTEATKRGCVGIAAYKQTTGLPVAVYGPGNICRAIASSNTIKAGDTLVAAAFGKLDKPSEVGQDTFKGSGCVFIALEDTDAVNHELKVLIR